MRVKRRPSRPPLIKEVIAFGATLDLYSPEPERFFDYYDALGWMVGSTPIRNWRAKMKAWRTQHELKEANAEANKKPPGPALCDFGR